MTRLITKVSEGDLNPTPISRALAPQASASAIPPLGQDQPELAAKASGSGCADPSQAGADRPASRAAAPMVGKVVVTLDAAEAPVNPSDDVVEVVSRLIRFDTTNTGEPETTRGEAECARWIGEQLAEVGYQPEYVESGAPGRGNVFVRLPGADSSRGALLIHGHLDVVPAEPAEWSVHPFSGAVEEGFVWGRGAVDMKDMVGMMVVVARQLKRAGIVPPATWCSPSSPTKSTAAITGAVAGPQPARALRRSHRGHRRGGRVLVDRAATRRGERRLYVIETAEKGLSWMRLTARDRPGTAPWPTTATPSPPSPRPSPGWGGTASRWS